MHLKPRSNHRHSSDSKSSTLFIFVPNTIPKCSRASCGHWKIEKYCLFYDPEQMETGDKAKLLIPLARASVILTRRKVVRIIEVGKAEKFLVQAHACTQLTQIIRHYSV